MVEHAICLLTLALGHIDHVDYISVGEHGQLLLV